MAELKLNKPLCFFDLETTGMSLTDDKIVEISILKVFPNHNKESKTWYVNPEKPIPKQVSEIHGITDEMVKNEPTFKEIAPQVINMIKDSDLAGYNSNRFDIPLLAEELLSAGFDFDIKKYKPIDVQVIFHKKEPRTLSAAYKFYCNTELENAHSAKADTDATYEILKAQLSHYSDLENNTNFLHNFTQQTRNTDLAGYIQKNDKDEDIISFGKYKGQKVIDVFKKDPSYYSWLQNAKFPLYTKKIFTEIKLKENFNSFNF